jgi:nucleoside-diphosphate-sugar epimerase
VEIVLGDVRDERVVARAIDGCSIVVHCASAVDAGLQPRASSTFLGTKIVARVALQQKVQRFVHISSAAVYGSPGEVEVTEGFPLRPRWKNDVYAAAKIAGEHLVLNSFLEGLRAAIIQPTIIYGPYSGEWSIHPLRILRTADYALPQGGLLSPVYVDDVVRAIILAATKKEAEGQRYIISGSETIEWTKFYQAYARMHAKGQVLAITDDEYSCLAKQRRSQTSFAELARLIARHPEIRRAARKNPSLRWLYNFSKRFRFQNRLQFRAKHSIGASGSAFRLGEAEKPAAFLPGAVLWKLYKGRSRYSIEKAKRELGYHPQIGLEWGMELTAQWARWARLI